MKHNGWASKREPIKAFDFGISIAKRLARQGIKPWLILELIAKMFWMGAIVFDACIKATPFYSWEHTKNRKFPILFHFHLFSYSSVCYASRVIEFRQCLVRQSGYLLVCNLHWSAVVSWETDVYKNLECLMMRRWICFKETVWYTGLGIYRQFWISFSCISI